MKTCTLCKTEKPLIKFLKRKDQKDGFHFWCKPCLKIKKAESYQKNREKALAKMAGYRAANPEKVSAAKKAAYAKNPEKYAAKRKAAYAADPETAKEKSRIWRAANPERVAENAAKDRKENREKRRVYQLEYQKTNRDSYNAYQLSYRKRRYKTDPLYALESLCRSRILIAMRKQGFRKTSPTCEMVGCTYEELTSHLERQFAEGMRWENRGTAWHIDHRLPLASASTAQQLEALCHFSNLQPLWAEDNYAKGAKMPHEWEGLNHGRLDHLQADRR